MLLMCSYFSPLLKSITNRSEVDYAMIDKDLEERENFIASLESRFLFLAADARSTLRLSNVGFMHEIYIDEDVVRFSSFVMKSFYLVGIFFPLKACNIAKITIQFCANLFQNRHGNSFALAHLRYRAATDSDLVCQIGFVHIFVD